ncbi:MAG: hypothetical protein F4Z54_01565 [Acidimicrobiaceae bacterium]|nr:hypothetical protein [Acidimicrobiaceae bacterium]
MGCGRLGLGCVSLCLQLGDECGIYGPLGLRHGRREGRRGHRGPRGPGRGRGGGGGSVGVGRGGGGVGRGGGSLCGGGLRGGGVGFGLGRGRVNCAGVRSGLFVVPARGRHQGEHGEKRDRYKSLLGPAHGSSLSPAHPPGRSRSDNTSDN